MLVTGDKLLVFHPWNLLQWRSLLSTQPPWNFTETPRIHEGFSFSWFFFPSLVGVIGEPSPLNQTELAMHHCRLHSSSSVFCTLNCSGRWGGEHTSGISLRNVFGFESEGSWQGPCFWWWSHMCFCSSRLDIHVSLFGFWINMNSCVRSVSFPVTSWLFKPNCHSRPLGSATHHLC